jgi:tetratricopeptide (TPR) repeat protein
VAGQAHGGPARVERYQERLADAAKAYERDRYRDALKLLKPLAETLPGASAVRELYGLTLYRLGRWGEATRELEAYRALEPDSYDQHPTLADCYRARKRWKQVEELWDDLRQASPTAELVAEGRIVAAGALADQGKLAEAIALLEKARTDGKRPRPHHLRIWYVLADLYERAGETPRARDLFRRILAADPELYDTADRLRAIR